MPWTPEQINGLISAVGYPIAVSLALFYAISVVSKRMFQAMDGQIKALQDQRDIAEAHAQDFKLMQAQNTAALSANTASNKDVTVALKGMVPTVCKADEIHMRNTAALKPGQA
jgi:hypothetical protein